MGGSRLGPPTVMTPAAWQPPPPPPQQTPLPPQRAAEAPAELTPEAARGRVAVTVWVVRLLLLVAVLVYGEYVARQLTVATVTLRWVSEPTVLAVSLCVGVALEAADRGERAAAARRAATVVVLLISGSERSAVALLCTAALALAPRQAGWQGAPWFLAAWAGPLAVCALPAATPLTAVAAACFAAQTFSEAFQSEESIRRALWLANDATLVWACCTGLLTQ